MKTRKYLDVKVFLKSGNSYTNPLTLSEKQEIVNFLHQPNVEKVEITMKSVSKEDYVLLFGL